jgi:hypothetical protein
LRKIIELDETLGGESVVRPVLLWGANGRPLRELDNVKTASEAGDFIKSVEPKPGMTIVLVLALGAYEFYDLNRNGDGFNESPYRIGFKPTCGHSECERGMVDGWITQEDTIPFHYKSFETMGKNYMHHVNKDPKKAVGDILKSFWNPTMHRIELLVGIDNTLAPEIVQRIADGDYPAVSMGCRIKYDVCTECGHRAPTRNHYCEHLKYGLRQVGKRGLRYGALNPSPRWFDLSWVIKPADQTGFMMKKVAHEAAYEIRASADLGEYLEAVDEKRAAIQKVSDIDKVVRGLPVDHKTSPLSAGEAQLVRNYHQSIQPALRNMPVMDDKTIGSLAQHPVAEVLSTLSAAGVVLTTPEFVKLILAKMAPGVRVDETTLDAMVALQGQIFDFFAKNPQALDQLMQTHLFDINAKNVKPEIAGKAEKYLEKRSTMMDYLGRALVPPTLRSEEPPFTDTFHVRDPATGHSYATTRGAATAAHDEIARRQLVKMLGGGAMLAGAYKLLAPGLPAMLRPVAAGTAGLLGYKYLRPNWGPQYMTDEGVAIPASTELSQERTANEFASVALPVLGSAALVAGLGHDYESRLNRGEFVSDPNAPIHTRLFNKLEQHAHEHPALTMLGSLSAYGLGANALGKLAEFLGDVLEPATDSVHLPDVDVDRAAEKIGTLLVHEYDR